MPTPAQANRFVLVSPPSPSEDEEPLELFDGDDDAEQALREVERATKAVAGATADMHSSTSLVGGISPLAELDAQLASQPINLSGGAPTSVETVLNDMFSGESLIVAGVLSADADVAVADVNVPASSPAGDTRAVDTAAASRLHEESVRDAAAAATQAAVDRPDRGERPVAAATPTTEVSSRPEPAPNVTTGSPAPPRLLALRRAVSNLSIAGLKLINLPLKWVPESKRIYIDWLAVSLAFWAPVVWLFAYVVLR